uniref:Uncharacterized protein n=1 Tax=Molossus molossus TaxID=27622 RepID=A0A7J8BAD8_MOLMO|nr:hypothetical protein HJG59_010464 [Molossus molossus]
MGEAALQGATVGGHHRPTQGPPPPVSGKAPAGVRWAQGTEQDHDLAGEAGGRHRLCSQHRVVLHPIRCLLQTHPGAPLSLHCSEAGASSPSVNTPLAPAAPSKGLFSLPSSLAWRSQVRFPSYSSLCLLQTNHPSSDLRHRLPWQLPPRVLPPPIALDSVLLGHLPSVF